MSKQKEAFGTREWASFNENFISGCIHDCLYCYSKEMAIRFKRKTPETWPIEELNKKKLNGYKKAYNGRVMFPSSHDITPSNLSETIVFLCKLLQAGNELLIVSKPHYECIKDICEEFNEFKKRILFRFTIGSPNSQRLKFWEPSAPSYSERMKALKLAYNKGFMTSISIEPMLDNRENINKLVNALIPYVTDAIWIGKPNFLKRRMKMNGISSEEAMAKATELDSWCSDEEIVHLYNDLKKIKKVKWKESIKKVVGLSIPKKSGMDI